MKKLIIIIGLCAIFGSSNLLAMSSDEMVQDAQTIINIFRQQYAPLKWKEENLGFDFEAEASKFLDSAKTAKSDLGFYDAAALFMNSFKDAHVSYSIPSSLYAYLPFKVAYYPDGVVVTALKRGEGEQDLGIEEGDLLLEMDGKPVVDVIDEVSKYSDDGYLPSTRKGNALIYLTYRPNERFPVVPYGIVKLKLKRYKTGETYETEMTWREVGLGVAQMPPKSAISYMSKMIGHPRPLRHSFSEASEGGDLESINWIPAYHRGNDREGTLDKLTVISNSPFLVGEYEANGKKIGYINIPSWKSENSDMTGNFIAYLGSAIKRLNETTDALVIDQRNNGGGSICFTQKVAQFFSPQPLDEMKFQLRANRQWLAGNEEEAYNTKDESVIHFIGWLDELRRAVEEGLFLSRPMPFCTYDGKFYPNRDDKGMPILYVKPVVVLVNELDFSAADMFPAVMQDKGLATIFGARTAGAGGSVMRNYWNPLGNSEMSIKLTLSLAYRDSENVSDSGITTHYIENLGVQPDVEYQETTKDYYDNGEAYWKAVNDTVLGLLGSLS